MSAVLVLVPLPSAAEPQKPNIVFILVDNLGWGELGVCGGGILRGAPTPRIDKLAGEGLRLLKFPKEFGLRTDSEFERSSGAPSRVASRRLNAGPNKKPDRFWVLRFLGYRSPHQRCSRRSQDRERQLSSLTPESPATLTQSWLPQGCPSSAQVLGKRRTMPLEGAFRELVDQHKEPQLVK